MHSSGIVAQVGLPQPQPRDEALEDRRSSSSLNPPTAAPRKVGYFRWDSRRLGAR